MHVNFLHTCTHTHILCAYYKNSNSVNLKNQQNLANFQNLKNTKNFILLFFYSVSHLNCVKISIFEAVYYSSSHSSTIIATRSIYMTGA